MLGVAQFALPAFATMTRALPELRRRDSALTSTGAARTQLRVNTPAARSGPVGHHQREIVRLLLADPRVACRESVAPWAVRGCAASAIPQHLASFGAVAVREIQCCHAVATLQLDFPPAQAGLHRNRH